MRSFMKLWTWAFLVGIVAVLGIGCGGQALAQVDEVSFHPGTGTSGYGLTSGYWLKLSEGTGPSPTRTLSLQLSDIKSGSYAAGGGDSAALLVESAQWTQTEVGVTTTFRAVSGVVTLKESATPVEGKASLGTLSGHLDLMMVDTSDASHEIHVTGDYVASVTSVG
jgi:hypothetical protein